MTTTTTTTEKLCAQPKVLDRLVAITRRCERMLEAAKALETTTTEPTTGGGDAFRVGHAG